jgi:hypothetical protein
MSACLAEVHFFSARGESGDTHRQTDPHLGGIIRQGFDQKHELASLLLAIDYRRRVFRLPRDEADLRILRHRNRRNEHSTTIADGEIRGSMACAT